MSPIAAALARTHRRSIPWPCPGAFIAPVAALTAAAASFWALLRHRGPPRLILTAAEKSSCGLTVEATEGPYHVTGMPELTTQLIVPAKDGDRLTFDTDDIAEGLPSCQLLALDETTAPTKSSFDFRV